jgi:inner membrane protein
MVTLYTHGFVGLGMARLFAVRRLPLLFWVLAALLPMVPDFDTFWLSTYGNMSGHRGFTHSFVFALAVGLLTALFTFTYFKAGFWPLAGFFFVITASHGILDACNNGGFGIPLFWPFVNHRFGPWGPIQVPDIGFELPDPRKSKSIRQELLWVWLPTVVLVGLVTVYRWLLLLKRRTKK